MTQSFTHFELLEEHHQSILAHIFTCLPEEGCGLVGGYLQGSRAQSAAVIPVENELHSPVRFRMAPTEQLKALLWLEEQGQELLAIFHSHPAGPDHPSVTDLTEFAYPGTWMLICSPDNLIDNPALKTRWQVRAFRIDGILSPQAAWSEVPFVISPAAPTNPKISPRNPNESEGL